MRIYLATWLLEKSQGDTLTKVNKRERLVSYYHTVERAHEFEQYIRTGTNENIPCNNCPRK